MTQSAQAQETLPGSLPVAVILERRVAGSPWVDYIWSASGIAVGQHPDSAEPRLVREDGETAWFLAGGFQVSLFADECESYYYNLVSDTPRAYVLAHAVDDGGPPAADPESSSPHPSAQVSGLDKGPGIRASQT